MEDVGTSRGHDRREIYTPGRQQRPAPDAAGAPPAARPATLAQILPGQAQPSISASQHAEAPVNSSGGSIPAMASSSAGPVPPVEAAEAATKGTGIVRSSADSVWPENGAGLGSAGAVRSRGVGGDAASGIGCERYVSAGAGASDAAGGPLVGAEPSASPADRAVPLSAGRTKDETAQSFSSLSPSHAGTTTPVHPSISNRSSVDDCLDGNDQVRAESREHIRSGASGTASAAGMAGQLGGVPIRSWGEVTAGEGRNDGEQSQTLAARKTSLLAGDGGGRDAEAELEHYHDDEMNRDVGPARRKKRGIEEAG